MKNQRRARTKPEPHLSCHSQYSLLPFPLPLGFSRHQSCALAPNSCYPGLSFTVNRKSKVNSGCCQAAYAGTSVARPSPHCKARNVPAQWGHLTLRGGRDKQGTVLYLAYWTVEMIFKMALTYIALTQQVLILCYLGDALLHSKLPGSVTSTETFICYYLLFREVFRRRNSILNASKFKMYFNWAACTTVPLLKLNTRTFYWTKNCSCSNKPFQLCSLLTAEGRLKYFL